MGSQERSKKKVHMWKKATLHFFLCFVMGIFTGLAPTNSSMPVSKTYAPEPMEAFHDHPTTQNLNRSLLGEPKKAISQHKHEKRLVIVITPTNKKDRVGKVLIRRLANTLRLVPQPLLWIVVEQKSNDSEVSEILRKTGIMYRHIVFNENFTDVESEMDHQRNIALNHIEQHRLSGIVHFASLSNVHDLSFFEEIRAIEAFGTWTIAKLSGNRRKVVTEGAVCDSSSGVKGWHFRRRPPHVSTFAFNTSILWDPERWGRASSVQQNSLKFAREGVVEEESKVKGIPEEDCSKVLMWDLKFC